VVATAVAVVLALLIPISAGQAASPAVTVFAGGLGAGPATNLGMTPLAVSVRGQQVLVAEGPAEAKDLPLIDNQFPGVVRAVDTVTGNETVVAGDGRGASDGNGGAATLASFGWLGGAVRDSEGNLYVAEVQNHIIRKVDPSGTVRAFAGRGVPGHDGDGGPALDASLYMPGSMAIGPDGSLFLTDGQAGRVRKIDRSGIITTVAGTTPGFSGDGGPAVLAQFNRPLGLGFDGAGNLYVADAGNGRVRKVDSTGLIRTIAGNGGSGPTSDGAALSVTIDPTGLAVSRAGEVVFVDWERVRRIDSNGNITTLAGGGGFGFGGDGGPATDARLGSLYSVAVDEAGNVYVVDSANKRIRRIDPSGTISTLAGNGSYSFGGDGGQAVQSQLRSPGNLRSGPGGVLIADIGNQRIRRVDASGRVTTVRQGNVGGAVADAAGNTYVSESNRVLKFNPAGEESVMAGTGVVGFSGDGGLAVLAQLSGPGPLAIDGAGNLYVADNGNRRVRKVSPAGIITTAVGSGIVTDTQGYQQDAIGPEFPLEQISDLVVDSRGVLYMAEPHYSRIRKLECGIVTTFAGDGSIKPSGDGYQARQSRIAEPAGLAADSAGNVYVSGGGVIRRIDSTGVISTVAGGGTDHDYLGAAPRSVEFPNIGGLAVDGTGNLLVATDSWVARVLKITGLAAPWAAPGAPCLRPPHRPVRAWGSNVVGQLGDGTHLDPGLPVYSAGLSGVSAVAAGAFHSLALKEDGTVWAWGWNSQGQLGDGTTTDRTVPVQVAGLSGVRAIAAGGYHSLAVKYDGTVWAWGWNVVGELGDGTTIGRLTPVRVQALGGVTSVSAGVYHNLALAGDGTVWSWGWNGVGQLGDGTTVDRHVPIQIRGSSGGVAVAAGAYHSLALHSAGVAAAWGWNALGQLGDGTTVDRHSPVLVQGLTGVTGLGGGVAHSLARKNDGTVWAWGWNALGQLGAQPGDSLVPTKSGWLPYAVSVSAGYYHSLAVTDTGAVYAWGWNHYGQMGVESSLEYIMSPSQIRGVRFAARVAGGGLHTIGVWDFG